ncbi:MAG: hypothetical protein IT581_23760 [Verrucomicrobiales bacterium]|nr:hypothetical protein [Verrucomicrobiales bacterium]
MNPSKSPVLPMAPRHLQLLVVVACITLAAVTGSGKSAPIRATVEVEETVYQYEPANNGAGPMWCSGSTSLVRIGEEVYASGLETVAGAKPLNNCRWVLWRRSAGGWQRWAVDESGLTREPAPLATVRGRDLFLSGNPALNPGKEGGGPARPELWQWTPSSGSTPRRLLPEWQGAPKFSEHSYRTFIADGVGGAVMLFQNIDYTHAEWCFRDPSGNWSAQGQLRWPWGVDYAKPQPIRICYPTAALKGKSVHFFGVSDITEPNPAWREYKRQLTGREWDYDFRRLYYTWTPDVTREPFADWVEVASREATCGWMSPCDLWVDSPDTVQLLWKERALDERLREKFFPQARQSQSLVWARVKQGRVIQRRILMESREDAPGPVVNAARFHGTPDGRLFVVRHVSGDGGGANELVELGTDGNTLSVTRLTFAKPFTQFFTASTRAGSSRSGWVDLLGVQAGAENAIGYARVRLTH